MAYYLGIDIGSTTSKGVITEDGKIHAEHVLSSGINHRDTAERLREQLLDKAKLSWKDIAYTVATGSGAANVAYLDQQVTDTRCCARGINKTFPSARTIIDIQAQYSQIIRLNERGQVINFVSSEKCAAGSGRFMEVIANVLQIDLNDIGPISLKSKNPITFTTSCAVFGESEAISRVAEGIPKEDILAGVNQALADKMSALIGRVGLEPDYAICGGGGMNRGLLQSLQKRLGVKLLVPPKPRMVTALGAAISAQDIKEGHTSLKNNRETRITRGSLGGEL
ncbi:acyl-CoA dehydratase activase [Chloroflexota bacterium]